jgi:hypothetical protein
VIAESYFGSLNIGVAWWDTTTILSLEHVRHESVEAERFAILAQELHFLDTHGPHDISIRMNV